MKLTIEADTQEELDETLARLAGKSTPPPFRRTRVFYVDVGSMPPGRAKEYLQQVKEEFTAAQLKDSQYENFFIATRDQSQIQVL